MRISLLLLSFLFFSCQEHTETIIQKEKVPVDVLTFQAQDFEGYYFLPNGGILEIIAASDNKLTVMREEQSILLENAFDGTLGTMPQIYKTALEPQDNVIKWSVDLSFSAGNGLLEDISGVVINGVRRVDVEIKLVDLNQLKIRFKIYENRTGNDINKVVLEQLIESI